MTGDDDLDHLFGAGRPPVQAERQQRRVRLTGRDQHWLALCRAAIAAGADAASGLLSQEDRAALGDNPHQLAAAEASRALAVALATPQLSDAAAVAALQPVIAHAERAGLVSTDLQLIDPRLPMMLGTGALPVLLRRLLVGEGEERIPGLERVRGFVLLLAQELADRRCRVSHSTRTTVLLEVGGTGVTATLHLRHLDDGPVGLHPDPARMLFLEADAELARGFAEAWQSSRGVGKACVAWSVTHDHGVPATRLRGPSMAAAMAIGLDDLLPRPYTGRWRWRTLDTRSAVTAGLDGAALTRVGYYGEKLKAAQLAALRVIVAKSEVSEVREQAPAGFEDSVRGAATLPEAIRYTRRRYNLAAFGAAALAVVMVGVVGAGGVALADARRSERAAQAVAERVRVEAQSRLIASATAGFRETDPAVAQLMAVAAYRHHPTDRARSALLDSTAVPTPGRFVTGTSEISSAVDPVGGRWVASIGADGELRLSSTAHYSTVLAAIPLTDRATAPAIAVDRAGRTLAVAVDGAVHLVEVDGGTGLRRRAELPVAGTVRAVAFGAGGAQLAAGTAAGGVLRWDIGAAAVRELPALPMGAETIVTFDGAGTLLVAGDGRGALRFWDIADPGSAPRQVFAHTPEPTASAWIHALAVSPDGSTLAVTGRSTRVTLWRIAGAGSNPIRELSGFGSYVNDVGFSADGTLLTAGGSDNTARVWRVNDPADAGEALLASAIVTAVEFAPDGRTLIAAGADGVLRFWPRPGPVLPGSTGKLYQTWFDRSGTRLLTGSNADDPITHHWDFSDPAAPTEFPGLRMSGGARASGAAALAPGGSLAAAGTTSGGAQLWDVSDPENPRWRAEFPAVREIVGAMAFDPTGSILVVAGQDDSVATAWDVSDPAAPVRIAELDCGPGLPSMVAFAPQGDLLAISTSDDRVLLWDVTDPRRPRPRPPLADLAGRDVLTVAIDRSGRLLAAGDADHSVHLFDIADRDRPRRLAVLRGPADALLTVNFGPDSDRVVAGGADGGAWIWDLAQPEVPFAELRAYEGRVNDVAYGAGGRFLVGAGPAGVLRVWATDPDAVIAGLCASGTSGLTREEWPRYLAAIPYRELC
ncbi:WD40 repeat domain-containing protein [Nocardia jiangsuensis]|uniref:WD40 repeat domain-containing protein n=1 Tax=Nocardia jiangsuensis TaxID=1691563 RepID=A0ABV8DQQ7_9NOCA